MQNTRYQILTQDKIEMIHENTLRILENIGVVMTNEDARRILAEHGAVLDGEIVRFPRRLVEKAIEAAPSSYTIHGRDPEKNVDISLDTTAYVGPAGSPFVMDMEKGRREGTLEDFNNIVKICHCLENIDIQSFLSCETNDIDVRKRPTTMMYNTLKYSDKPLMGSVLGYKNAKDCLEMAAIVFGGKEEIKKNPVMAGIPCSLTPLSYDSAQLGAIIAYAEYGQPQLINSLCMAGTTAPATIAGLVSVQNAEVLSGIVLAQCVNPGTPVVYSASGTSTDMSSGSLAIGSSEDALISLINGQLCKYYKIPCRISGALSDSKMMDSQAAYESSVTISMAQMAGGNFILHGGGILETYNTVSFEKLIIDNEVLGMWKRIDRGVEVNEETLAYDVIEEVGPKGVFLMEEHTLEHYHDEFYRPTLSDRKSFTQWAADGGEPIERVANRRWKEILDLYEEPALPADVDAALKKYMGDI